MNCVFCKRPETEIVAENDLALAFCHHGGLFKNNVSGRITELAECK